VYHMGSFIVCVNLFMRIMYNRNYFGVQVLRMMAVRRRQLSQSGRSEIPPPQPPPPHPGYAPNAAFHAIKRHALEFVNPKEMMVSYRTFWCILCPKGMESILSGKEISTWSESLLSCILWFWGFRDCFPE